MKKEGGSLNRTTGNLGSLPFIQKKKFTPFEVQAMSRIKSEL